MKKYSFITFLLVLIAGLIISGFKSDKKPETVQFYSPQKGVYIVDVNVKECPGCIKPYFSDSLETVKSVGEKTGAIAAINAGFFDPSNTLTTSYVIKDGNLIGDPKLNPHLMNNAGLQEYMPAILNRSEFRIENCTLNIGTSCKLFDIKQHNDPAEMKCEILHSIQAGPELLPNLKLSDEAFVVEKNGKVVKESAGALGKYARSAIGIKDDHILLVAVGNESPMTIKELAEFMKSLNVKQAMAFDGGSSTSLYINLPGQEKFILTSAKNNAARRVKSVLLVKIES